MEASQIAQASLYARKGYASAEVTLALMYEVQDLRQQLDKVAIRPGLTDDEIVSFLGEGFHTAWRKAVDCPEAVVIHRLIKDMDPEVWGAVIHYVADPLITWLRAQPQEAQ
jgi:hypothetical protein